MIHPTAIIDKGAKIGKGTKVWHYTHIMGGADIGENCTIGQGVFIADTKVGNNCKIQNNVSIFEGVTLEDYVFVGPSAVFTNVKYPTARKKQGYTKTLVKEGATIGAGSVIICGVTIGKNSMIGAGAVVTDDVPDNMTVVGIPAKELCLK